MTTQTKAYATSSPTSDLKGITIQRRDILDNDVQIEILYSGVCHSDLHQARNDWGGSVYPLVAGHEIIGKVSSVGSKVTTFKVGDTVGVGCMVDSCRTCSACHDHLEQYCSGTTYTYNSEDAHLGGMTYGGYSQHVVVDEKFVLRVPENLDLAASAPLLCAGITTYSPLRHWNVQKGQKVGIIGMGGLGHMGIKFAVAMGAYVVVLTTSENKRQDALDLGANEVLITTDAQQMTHHASSFDFLLNTIPVEHDVNPYLGLLKRDSTMVIVGALVNVKPVSGGQLIMQRRHLAGSLIGGIQETQEMLDFCGQHNITSNIETIRMQDINEAFERMLKNDVKYRFVIDITQSDFS